MEKIFLPFYGKDNCSIWTDHNNEASNKNIFRLMEQIWNSWCSASIYNVSSWTLFQDLSSFFSLHLFKMERVANLIKDIIILKFSLFTVHYAKQTYILKFLIKLKSEIKEAAVIAFRNNSVLGLKSALSSRAFYFLWMIIWWHGFEFRQNSVKKYGHINDCITILAQFFIQVYFL